MYLFDIAAYAYRAEMVCGECLIESMIEAGDASPAARDMSYENALDQIADANAIDRENESSFDSDEFPKVVFVADLEQDERCDVCGDSLTD